MVSYPRVALLVDTATTWGRRLIRGVTEYARKEGPWIIHVEPRGRYEKLSIPKGWEGQGVIVRATRLELARELSEAQIPSVNLSWSHFPDYPIARCTSSEREAASMAAEYFLGNGLRHFAYCGPWNRPGTQDLLKQSFLQVIEQAGCPCHVYSLSSGPKPSDSWLPQQDHFANWLVEIDKPVGILAWSAARGRQITEACQYAGIRVPEHVAVLGGDDDELMADISTPPLSTIVHAGKQIGYSAAKMLDQLMQGKDLPIEDQLLPPSGIAARQSTDYLAIDDEWVAMAMRCIRDQAHKGIHVKDILAEVPISRRGLEQRFLQWIGRTPAAEIRRVRIEKAKHLLLTSDLSAAQIARAAGFGQQQVLSRTFRREVGRSPTQYRYMNRQ